MRRFLWLMLFAVGLAVGVTWYFRDAESDDLKEVPPPNSAEREDDEEVEGVDHSVPYSEYLRRLGTPNGGVWSGKTGGVRVLLRLDEDGPDGIDYLAVLRDDEHPRVHVFYPYELLVDLNGGFVLGLSPQGKDSTPGAIFVYGEFVDGAFRFEKVKLDKRGVIPPGVVLKRFSGKIDSEEARLRTYLEKAVGPRGPPEFEREESEESD